MKLYKYQSINKYSLSGIAKGELFYCSPARLNDPFEFRVSFPPCSEEYLTEFFPEVLGKHDDATNEVMQVLYEMLQKTISTFGVLSLSKLPASPIMWSHYADEHKGMCLEFDYTGSSETGIDVTYSNHLPVLSDPKKKLWSVANALQFMMTKHADWVYEKEVRFVRVDGEASRPYGEDLKLTSISFGARTIKDDECLVRALVKSADVQFFRAILSSEDFTVHFEET